MLNADQKAIQQLNFAGNLDQPGPTFFITEEKKLFWVFYEEQWEHCKFVLYCISLYCKFIKYKTT